MKIDFSPPYIDDDVKAEVLSSLDSGWITTGPKVKALEQLLSAYVGGSPAVCCSSATASLMLALHWYGIGNGDEVIIPAYTYAATALAVMHVGATVVMVDCGGQKSRSQESRSREFRRGEDFNLDVDKVKSKITSRTKAIIPVDIGGWPSDYERLIELVNLPEVLKLFKPAGEQQKKLGHILLLADSAHSLGANYKKKSVAQWPDLTVFSFHAVKNVTTAEGGAIVLNLAKPFDNVEVSKTLKLWSLNGQTKDAFTKSQAGGWKYDIVYPGFKMNMPDICAALGLAQLRKYGMLLDERRRVVAQYAKAFGRFDWAELPPADNELKQSSCHLYALRIRNIAEAQRDAMIEYITSEDVSVNVHFIPLPMLTVFKERGYKIEDFPVAYDNYSREISLPVYPQLSADMVERVITAVVNAYGKLKQ